MDDGLSQPLYLIDSNICQSFFSYTKEYEVELNSFMYCIKSRLGKIKDIREVTKSNAHLFPSYLATKALQYDEITTQHAVTRGLLRVDLIIQGWMWWALSGGH